jgi:hypothetical protein
MGIYDSGNIYGIRIYNFNDDDFSNTLYERKYDVTMNYKQKIEAYLFYTNLNNKKDIFFKIYTECSTTYDINNKEKFMGWYPMSLDLFLEKIGICN